MHFTIKEKEKENILRQRYFIIVVIIAEKWGGWEVEHNPQQKYYCALIHRIYIAL